WISVCSISLPTTPTGDLCAGLIAAVGLSTNQPYCFVSTLPTVFVASEKASLSNSGTVWPFVKVALPQVELEDGSLEYFFASAHQSPPLFSCWKSVAARALLPLPTRMYWKAREAAVWY